MIPTPTQLSSRPEQGFTLLELMVVAAIIAILVSIGSVTFFSQRGEAKKDRARADLQVIQQGLEAYRARFGDYPRIRNEDPDEAIDATTYAKYLLNSLCGQLGPTGDVISGRGIPVMLNTSLLTYKISGLPLSSVGDNFIVDPWGVEYAYNPEAKNADNDLLFGYDLRSAGPDKEFGTEDDIVAQ